MAFVTSLAFLAFKNVLLRDCAKATITFSNQTGQKITQLTLTVSGRKYSLENILPHVHAELTFPIMKESNYIVTIVTSDGTRLEEALGHADPRADLHDTITIYPTKLELVESWTGLPKNSDFGRRDRLPL